MYCWLKPALLVGAGCIFLFWIDTPGFRHGFVISSRLQECSVAQIINLPKDVDFVAIGSSRIRRGVDPETLEATSGGSIVRAYNFGRSGISAARNYRMVKDLIGAGFRPSVFLLEVDLDALGNNATTYMIPSALDNAFLSFTDIFDKVNLHQEISLLERLHGMAVAVLAKIRSSLTYLLTGDVFQHHARAWSRKRADQVCSVPMSSERGDSGPKRIEEGQRKYRDIFAVIDDSVSDDRFIVGHGVAYKEEVFYLAKIRSLLTRFGIPLLVTRPWEAFQPPLSAGALYRIRTVVPEFIYPEPEFVRSTWPLFFDEKHFDLPGRVIYSQWIGRVIEGVVQR